jgi:hypothetical protein
VRFKLTAYDGGLRGHSRAEERGELLLGSSDRPRDVQLRFEGSPEIFAGDVMKYLLTTSATGANSCRITMSDREDPSVCCTFELPKTHFADFNSYYDDWRRQFEPAKQEVLEPWTTELRRKEVTLKVKQDMFIVTTNEISGYRISKVHGDVFGLTVRARNYFSNLGAHLQTVVGGAVSGYTRLLTNSRNEAQSGCGARPLQRELTLSSLCALTATKSAGSCPR